MNTQTKIDRQASDPAYLQLVNILKSDIGQGIYLPGDRLPSDSKLCKQYGVSPMTVRRSINIPIRGTVSQPKIDKAAVKEAIGDLMQDAMKKTMEQGVQNLLQNLLKKND